MNSSTFIDALRHLEREGDAAPLAALYADGAELWNPRLHRPMTGPQGAQHFWQEYRDAFGAIDSEFRSVTESDGRAALEWESSGTLRADGQPFRYRGVSVVEWSGDRITRFAAYFDPAPLTATTTSSARTS